MKKAVALLLVVLGLAGWWSWRERPRSTEAVATTPVAATSNPEARGVGPAKVNAAAFDAGLLTDLNDLLELTVSAKGAGVPSAEVVLYWRAGVAAATSEVRWQQAGRATTGSTGSVTLPAKPGTWLVSVRAAGWPAQLVEVLKPEGEQLTQVKVELAPGHDVVGFAHDIAGHGVAPAVIHATPVGSRNGRRGTVPEGVVTVDADATGHFRFANLAAGWWKFEGVAEGSGRADALVAQVPLDGEASLTFRATGFLEGVVVWPDGGVVPQARVTLVGEARTEPIDTGMTGTFSTEVEPGVYFVRASASGLVGSAPGSTVVHSGATSSARVTLSGRGGVVWGRVLASGELAVVGATVTASPHGESGVSAQALSDAQGGYRLEGLAPGTYDVDVADPRFAPTSQSGLQLSDGDEVHLDVHVDGLGRIHGKVVADSASVSGLSVTLRDEQGVRVSKTDGVGAFEFSAVQPGGHVVSVKREADEQPALSRVKVKAGETTEALLKLERPIAVTVTLDRKACPPREPVRVSVYPASGLGISQAYSFHDLPAGKTSLALKLTAGDWFTSAATSGNTCKSGVASQLTLKEGSTVPLVLNLVDHVHVKVVDAEGEPARSASVSAEGAEGVFFLRQTEDSGELDLELRDGLGHPQAGPITISAVWHGRFARVENVPADTKALTLTLGAPSAARVHVKGYTQPITLQLETVPFSTFVDELTASGPEVRLDELPAGTVLLRAQSADGSQSAMTKFATRRGEVVDVELTLAQSAHVSGHVKPPKGGEAWLSLVDERNAVLAETRSMADGSFEFEPCAPGTVLAQVRCDGCDGPTFKQTVVLKAGESVTLDFPLKATK